MVGTKSILSNNVPVGNIPGKIYR